MALFDTVSSPAPYVGDTVHFRASPAARQRHVEAFQQLFGERGLPAAIRSDNGLPIATT